MGILSEKVVLNDTLTDVFLSMAVQEELIEDDPEESDYFLDRYAKLNPPSYLKQIVLEQIVLAPNVLTLKWLPIEHLSGYIIEKGVLQHIEPPNTDRLRIGQLSADIIEPMLKAQNINIPKTEFPDRMSKAKSTFREKDDYYQKTGKSSPGLAYDIVNFSNPDNNWYTDAELRKFEEWDKTLKNAEPIRDAMMEFTNLSSISAEQDILMRVPTAWDERLTLIDDYRDFTEDEADIAIVRVASKQLSTSVHRETLKGSLDLANEANTKAFRKQLARWRKSFEENDLDIVDEIIKDVAYAQKQMKGAGIVENINSFGTYFGIPVGILAELGTSSSQLNIFLMAVGLASTLVANTTKHNYKWAMFGK